MTQLIDSREIILLVIDWIRINENLVVKFPATESRHHQKYSTLGLGVRQLLDHEAKENYTYGCCQAHELYGG